MVIAGQKLLWIIDFHSPGSSSEKPEIDFIPKINRTRQLIHQQYNVPLNAKAQDFLSRIQAMCSKITKDCQKEAITELDYLKKSHLVSKELGDLDELIKKLNDILKWFRPPGS